MAGSRILVVDDDAGVRWAVRRYLERHHARVAEAESAEEALTLLELESYDLLVTDIEMPGKSGTWLKKETQRRWPGIPVLIMTAAARERRRPEALRDPIDRFLLKPFSLLELEEAVERALRTRPVAGEVSPQAEPPPRGGRAPARRVDYRSLIEHLPAVSYIATTGPGASLAYISPQIEQLAGFSPDEWLASPMLRLRHLHPDDRSRVLEARARFRTTRDRFRCEYRLLTRDGRMVWVHEEAVVVAGARGREPLVHGLAMNVTERKLAEEALRNLALQDELTGLYNRRGFLAIAGQQLRVAERKRSRLVLLLADLDGLKRINDGLGHQEGDRALRETAGVLTDTFRKSDVLGRMGGDEFAILAIETGVVRDGLLSGRLQENVELHNLRRHERPSLSLSVGAAPYDPEDPHSLDELLAQADHFMYQQKITKNVR